jgi:hypothetical protein
MLIGVAQALREEWRTSLRRRHTLTASSFNTNAIYVLLSTIDLNNKSIKFLYIFMRMPSINQDPYMLCIMAKESMTLESPTFTFLSLAEIFLDI